MVLKKKRAKNPGVTSFGRKKVKVEKVKSIHNDGYLIKPCGPRTELDIMAYKWNLKPCLIAELFFGLNVKSGETCFT